MKNILSINADAKTIKGKKLGFLTGILYLAPALEAGRKSVCPSSKLAKCEAGCLYTAGNGIYKKVQAVRISKTQRFFDDKDGFMDDLAFSIKFLIRKAKREGLTPIVRLNGTSDILWETVRDKQGHTLLELFPTLQFYDYTKIPGRRVPANYDLTFSYSGTPEFQKLVEKVGIDTRIAVVFDKKETIPDSFLGRQVVCGDDTDVRHLDPVDSVVALYAKGRARGDFSGFVVRGGG